MIIGIVADPLHHKDWQQIEAFLLPAAQRGGVPVLEANEVVWAIYAPDLTGAATARLTEHGGEVVLVGGRESPLWIHELDWLICSWMRREGMARVRAYGRKGWRRVLKDWAVVGGAGGAVTYEKVL